VAVGNTPPHAGCHELGIVMASGTGGSIEHNMASAQNKVRNRAAEQGADFLVLDTSANDFNSATFSGRAFDCSSGPPPEPVVRAAAAPAVVPSAGGEATAAPPVAPAASVEERLQKLEDLYKKGLITDEERTKRRAEILQSI
jgi:hypothetical protein